MPAVHDAPPLMLLYTPNPLVAAYRVPKIGSPELGSTTKADTVTVAGRDGAGEERAGAVPFSATQFVPPFTLVYTPPTAA